MPEEKVGEQMNENRNRLADGIVIKMLTALMIVALLFGFYGCGNPFRNPAHANNVVPADMVPYQIREGKIFDYNQAEVQLKDLDKFYVLSPAAFRKLYRLARANKNKVLEEDPPGDP